MAPNSVFREAVKPKSSDMDVAQGGNAKAILEEHWDSWMRDEDWNWIKDHGYNSVRIPVSALIKLCIRSRWKRELMLDWILPFVWGCTGCIEENTF
jgi:hypothetical protein